MVVPNTLAEATGLADGTPGAEGDAVVSSPLPSVSTVLVGILVDNPEEAEGGETGNALAPISPDDNGTSSGIAVSAKVALHVDDTATATGDGVTPPATIVDDVPSVMLRLAQIRRGKRQVSPTSTAADDDGAVGDAQHVTAAAETTPNMDVFFCCLLDLRRLVGG